MTVKMIKDPNGRPAVDLLKLNEDGLMELSRAGRTVQSELVDAGMDGARARVVVLLDHSGSMRDDYANGTVQELLTRALGFGLCVDPSATVTIVKFDSVAHPPVMVTPGNYVHATLTLWNGAGMGSTNLAAALRWVRAIAEDSNNAMPIVCIVLTDGEPDSQDAATAEVIALSGLPVFLKFISLGKVEYLTYLDDLELHRPRARLIDNVDSKVIDNPSGLLPGVFAYYMVDEWSTWVENATAAGILTG